MVRVSNTKEILDDLFDDICNDSLQKLVNQEYKKLIDTSVKYAKGNSPSENTQILMGFLSTLLQQNTTDVEFMITHYAALGFLTTLKTYFEEELEKSLV